jgi:hypothetical protein
MSESEVRKFDEAPSRWAGFIVFAAAMMIIGGALNAMSGLVALYNDEWVVFGNRANLYLDLTTWGLIHLAVGVAVIIAGLGLFSGHVLARAVAVFVAGVSIVANFLSMPAYPVWSLTVIAVDVLVIYALTAHGRDLA